MEFDVEIEGVIYRAYVLRDFWDRYKLALDSLELFCPQEKKVTLHTLYRVGERYVYYCDSDYYRNISLDELEYDMLSEEEKENFLSALSAYVEAASSLASCSFCLREPLTDRGWYVFCRCLNSYCNHCLKLGIEEPEEFKCPECGATLEQVVIAIRTGFINRMAVEVTVLKTEFFRYIT